MHSHVMDVLYTCPLLKLTVMALCLQLCLYIAACMARGCLHSEPNSHNLHLYNITLVYMTNSGIQVHVCIYIHTSTPYKGN